MLTKERKKNCLEKETHCLLWASVFFPKSGDKRRRIFAVTFRLISKDDNEKNEALMSLSWKPLALRVQLSLSPAKKKSGVIPQTNLN